MAAVAATEARPKEDKRIVRDMHKKPITQLMDLNEVFKGKFAGVMFDLCPSVVYDVECKSPANCHFWHLCALCLKRGEGLEKCLERKHRQHADHSGK